MRIEHHLDIEATPEVVFGLTVDIERLPQLTPTVTTVNRLDHGPLRVGSQARLKQPAQRPAVWTVDALEPDQRFVWSTTTSGMRMVATHVVEPTAKGSRNSLYLDLSGIAATVLGPFLRRKIARVLATENEGFRREANRLMAGTDHNHTVQHPRATSPHSAVRVHSDE
jgi:hypothetical protein